MARALKAKCTFSANRADLASHLENVGSTSNRISVPASFAQNLGGMMIKPSTISKIVTAALATAVMVVTPRPALAVDDFGNVWSRYIDVDDRYIDMLGRFHTVYTIYEDPPSTDITSLTTSIQYNPALYTFLQATSGPLGAFSVGGGAATPVTAGVGTMPLVARPATGWSAGAPLAGSSLTYTDAAGVLTVNYTLANPVTVSGEVNVFALEFVANTPGLVKLGASTVTYLASGPGADFTAFGDGCTTVTGSNACGSPTPATGITLNPVFAPEPSTWAMMLVGLAGVGLGLRRRFGLQPYSP